MILNIQMPVKTPVEQIKSCFGSYIAITKKGFDGESCQLVEEIGDLDSQQYFKETFNLERFKNFEDAELYLFNYYKEHSKLNAVVLKKSTFGFNNYFKQKLIKFGYFNDFKTYIDNLKKINSNYSMLLAHPFGMTYFKHLDSTLNIPKYLLTKNMIYFYPDFSNGKINIRKLKVSATIVERITPIVDYSTHLSYLTEIKRSTEYLYSFRYDLCAIDDDTFHIEYSFKNILDYDGSKWGASSNNPLFESEEEAKSYISNIYRNFIENFS